LDSPEAVEVVQDEISYGSVDDTKNIVDDEASYRSEDDTKKAVVSNQKNV
jgi:hypothetical protein